MQLATAQILEPYVRPHLPWLLLVGVARARPELIGAVVSKRHYFSIRAQNHAEALPRGDLRNLQTVSKPLDR